MNARISQGSRGSRSIQKLVVPVRFIFYRLHLVSERTMAGISKVGCVLVQSLFFSSFLFQFCSALDTVRIGQSIRDGQTVISPQEVFVLGFFSPGSSKKRYVGIWYKKISVQTVVWVANRENPLTDRSGVLKVREDGNLVVIDGRNNTLWSTNVSFSSSEPTAKLLDSGNLALMKGNNDDPEKAPWKSFDHPCDSFLPGMEIGIDVNRHLNILTNSWKSPDDPSPGDFTVGVDPYGSPQLFVWKKKMKYWRIGQWNGQAFIGVPDVVNDQASRVDLVEENRFRYTKKTNSTARFLINSRGQQQLVQWDEQSKDWIERSSHPINQCEIYGQCGSNGHCNASSSPICRCLPGFEPKSLPDWNSRNWSSGCFRRTQLQCEMNDSYADSGDADGFWELTGMKLPDNNGLLSGIADLDECTNECKKNCSCTACAVVQGIGCMIWSEGLMDIAELNRYGQALHIRLAGSEIKKLLLEQQSEKQTSNAKGRRQLLVVILVVCVLGAVMLVAGTYFLWRWRLRQRDRREAAKYFSEENNLGEDRIHGNGPSLPLFDLGTIVAATENFSAANKLGEGGFGPVYKGKLSWGEEIAVKRLSRSSDQGVEEFKNEVILISKLQHRNLVRFIGCCIQGEEKLLFYEFMPNKSLDTFIFDLDKRALLDWRKRFQIIEGIARGLLYLHRDSRLKIIHRDLKASNILLDSEMNPKISDFGMARIFGGNQTEENTNRVMGTYGYMSPEYAMQGLFSEKSDVFSFGVLLLEIVSGKRNNSFCLFEHTLNLMGFAWHLWNEGKGMELMDAVLADSCLMNEVLRCIHVGLLCVQDAAIDRPTMPSVVSMLGSEIANLPTPKHPAFSINRILLETSSSSKNQGMCSTNNVTITMINGR